MRSEIDPVTSSPLRWLMAVGGVLCVAVGAVGIVLPGLPTTPFLLAASYLFVRSSPRLHRWMLTRPWLRPYLDAVRGDRGVRGRARVVGIAVLWLSLGSTWYLLHSTGRGGVPALLVLLLLALAVTILIWRWKRAAAAGGGDSHPRATAPTTRSAAARRRS